MNLIFFKKQFCRPPTVICLIERAADNLINFQVVVKKRLSKFELLKCCRIFQQRSPTDIVSDRELFKCCTEFLSEYKTNYSTLELCVCSRAYSTLSRDKECQIFVRPVSDIWYLQSLQSVYCGSQAVEHSYEILLSPIQTLAANN